MNRASEIIVLVVCALSGPRRLSAQQPTILEYPIPTTDSRPGGITQGPDGKLWFTESKANKIAAITTDGSITEYLVPTDNSGPNAITQGPDGNLWFTELFANKIGKITTDGTIAEYPLSTSSAGPYDITLGPDGNLWFTENSGLGLNRLGKITVGGSITEYSYPNSTGPVGITQGSDGNLWFTEPNQIGRITTDGVVTLFPLSDVPVRPFVFVDRQLGPITQGPDGNAWAIGDGLIWRIATNGATNPYPIPIRQLGFPGVAPGPDGNLWFTENYGNNIGRISTDGVIDQYSVPTSGALPSGIARGPDGNIWFTEQSGNNVGVLLLSTAPVDALLSFNPSSLTFNAVADTAFAPPDPQNLTISSTTQFSVYAGSYNSWLGISPSGDLNGTQSIDVTVKLTSLPRGPGVYTGFIVLSSGNATQTVPVTLNIAAP